MKTSPSISCLTSSTLLLLPFFSPTASGQQPSNNETTTTTLRLLVHNHPPMVEYVQKFNDNYESTNPNISINLTVVDPSDLDSMTQESIDNGTVDIIDIFGFANEVTRNMKNNIKPSASSTSWPDEADMPLWQNLVREGQLLDLTDQPFVSNYYKSAIEDAGSYKGQVYAVNLGLVSYSGMYVNRNLLASLELDMPQTFDEVVAACEKATSNGSEGMIVGGKDNWPIWVGTYGILGSIWSNPEEFVKDLWTGGAGWNDTNGLEFLRKVQTYSNSMLVENTTKALSSPEAATWFAMGNTLFLPSGSWDAALIDAANPQFNWTYVPFPGSDDKDANQYLYGKYDQGWAIASESPNINEALAYLSAFSDPTNYYEFINAVGFMPTQPINGTMTSQIGKDVMPFMNDEKFRVGFEQYWVKPPEVGAWAEADKAASWFQPFGEWDDYIALANQAQNDLELGIIGNNEVEDDDESTGAAMEEENSSSSGNVTVDSSTGGGKATSSGYVLTMYYPLLSSASLLLFHLSLLIE